jgi:WD40 repeat protein
MQHSIQFTSGSNQIISPNTQTLSIYNHLIRKASDVENTITSTDASAESAYEYGLTEFSVLKKEKHKSDVFLLIGKFDGSIEIFAKNESQTSKLCTLYNHQKLITCLKWNKSYFNEGENSELLLASGSNDSNVIIVDFKVLIDELNESFTQKDDSSPKEKSLFGKYKYKLVGHKERITCLSWSLDSKMLASSSYDSTVQVGFYFNITNLILFISRCL